MTTCSTSPPDATSAEGHALVAAVRDAARAHSTTWEALVPSSFEVNFAAEVAEEHAYAAMAAAKHRLRDHICAVYGLSIRELASLAQP